MIDLRDLGINMAKETGKILLENFRKEDMNLSWKGEHDVVTEVDHASEKYIIEQIRDSKMKCKILSEETGIKDLNGEEYEWIIDPLDGTVNYVRGLSQSSISIALYDDKKPVFGVLAIYPSEEIVWGGKNFGAFLGEEPINVSGTEEISNAILCTGFPSHFDVSNQKVLSKYFDLIGNFGKIRMLGSASISLFNVARGAADCYYEQEIMIWDVAAGIAILEGAGGEVSVSSGKFDNSLNVVASNGTIKCNLIEGQ